MTKEAKTEINRRNALRSTGPATPQGKARSARNALRHGLLSREMLILDERKRDLTALWKRLRAVLQPAGPLEELLLDRIASAAWRLRRMGRIEADVLEVQSLGPNLSKYPYGQCWIQDCLTAHALPPTSRYETALERSPVPRARSALAAAGSAPKGPGYGRNRHGFDRNRHEFDRS